MEPVIVSRFVNFRQSDPSIIEGKVNLFDFLDNPKYKEYVATIRSLNDPKEIKSIKSDLPCVTVSGEFSIRKARGLIRHSGYICLDIDGKDNPQITDVERQRDEIAKIPNVAYCSLSVSGKGLFCLVPVPNLIPHPELHKEYFKALQFCFKELGIIVDKNCSDITRLRVISYDPNRYRNEEGAVPFDGILKTQSINKPRAAKNFINSLGMKKITQGAGPTEQKVKQVINKIEAKGIDITENYQDWIQIGFAFVSEFGEEGRELFHVVSQFHPEYNPESADNKYTSLLNSSSTGGAVTIASFFHIAKEYGII